MALKSFRFCWHTKNRISLFNQHLVYASNNRKKGCIFHLAIEQIMETNWPLCSSPIQEDNGIAFLWCIFLSEIMSTSSARFCTRITTNHWYYCYYKTLEIHKILCNFKIQKFEIEKMVSIVTACWNGKIEKGMSTYRFFPKS